MWKSASLLSRFFHLKRNIQSFVKSVPLLLGDLITWHDKSDETCHQWKIDVVRISKMHNFSTRVMFTQWKKWSHQLLVDVTVLGKARYKITALGIIIMGCTNTQRKLMALPRRCADKRFDLRARFD